MNNKLTLLTLILVTLGLSSPGFAQQVQSSSSGVPQAMKYQAVARNSNGDAIASQPVSFRISIVEGSANGTTVYEETQTSTTNQFGLANLNIGSGNVVTGNFNTIDWSKGEYFLKIEFDPKGGDSYSYMGTSQLMSVPYSLYAEHSAVSDSVREFPIKAALLGTNLQAPFDSPQTGTLVYNTDSAGTGNYAVIPGYYYNAGTAATPNWVLLESSDPLNPNRGYHDACTGTNEFGLCAGGAIGASAVDNTGFGDLAYGNLLTQAGNSGFGYITGVNANSSKYTTNFGAYSYGSNNSVAGVNNTVAGYSSMLTIATQYDNTVIGYASLYSNTTSGYGVSSNTTVGTGNLSSNDQADANTAIGYEALNANTKGLHNTAMGYQALSLNTTASEGTAVGYNALAANTADGNTAVGDSALAANTTGGFNTSVGVVALYLNTTGSNNVAVGAGALATGTTNNCTAIGELALDDESGGIDNTAVGYTALGYYLKGDANTASGAFALGGEVWNSNAEGSFNTADGDSALFNNTSGLNNTAMGYASLLANASASSSTSIGTNALYKSTGSWNTALGDSAGFYNTTGTDNTYVGYKAGDNASLTTISNTTCVGYNSGASATTIGSNSIYLGNASIAHLYCEVTSISAYSDRRIKDNIKANVPGLAFITKLRPVTYNLNIHKQNAITGAKDEDYAGKYEMEKITQSGFIAQEVDSAAQACGYDFNGINRPSSPNGLYSLGYTDFVVPLVKAVQEQQQMIDSLKTVIAVQTAGTTTKEKQIVDRSSRVTSYEKEIAELKQMVQSRNQAQASIKQ